MGLNDPKCERGDLNPHTVKCWILSPVRLPVPPLSRLDYRFEDPIIRFPRCFGVENIGKFQGFPDPKLLAFRE